MAEADTAVRVAAALLEADAVSITPAAPVTFTSGLRSPVYVDNRRLIGRPGPWHTVIEAFAGRLAAGDGLVVAGVESAGIPHASALAYLTDRPSVFVRKGTKEHGLGRRIEGGEVDGRRAVLVEDMVTTGGSSLSAVEALRTAGAEVDTCLAIITYGFAGMAEAFAAADVELDVLTTFPLVLDVAVERGRIGEATAEHVRSWLADPEGWQGP